MKGFITFLDMRSYKNWAHKSTSEAIQQSEDLSCQFPRAQYFISALHPELLHRCWRSAASVTHNLVLTEIGG